MAASLSLDADSVPLRVVVSTAPGQSSASDMAGPHQLRTDLGFINYGMTGPGHWRFAFWGASLDDLRVTHGGPVSLRRGDIVISHARPFTDFAHSPFIGNRFPPMRIQYGSQQITIGRLTCVHHFYNGDRYECLIGNRFTWDAANHPTEITISRAAVAEHHEPQWYDLKAQTLVTDQPRWERDGSTPAPGKRITWSPADAPDSADVIVQRSGIHVDGATSDLTVIVQRTYGWTWAAWPQTGIELLFCAADSTEQRILLTRADETGTVRDYGPWERRGWRVTVPTGLETMLFAGMAPKNAGTCTTPNPPAGAATTPAPVTTTPPEQP